MENHVRRRITPYLSVLTLCTFLGAAAFADEIRLERRADWDSWTFPRSAVAQNDDGTIGLQRVGEAINAAADSRQFLHTVKSSKTPVSGGIRNVGSGAETVANVFDGQADTWWQPAADDALKDWWFGIDLGRVVYATKIRLIFPDTTDVVP
ncbi:MAG: hypothetical protein OSB03_16540, partial [Vicinamibacterales bacterium]|nr:hypothetical protein [Vicinamibacterales bacterium]